jgi:hypothetical protein
LHRALRGDRLSQLSRLAGRKPHLRPRPQGGCVRNRRLARGPAS